MSDYYILNDDHTTTPVEMMEWALWASKDKGKSVVKQDTFGEVRVSTVFLGLNHAYLGQGAPLIFETMIFGGKDDGFQERYSTWDQALKGHQKTIDLFLTPKKEQ